ncbi:MULTISPECIES: AraC family transcriptional regulator [Pseudomonas]|uniref:Helix-turn-helix transcriptional regulator n=2 Tax=Pseudomonas nitroreducens TaxID=46680 RepID=A0A6G6J6G5_PSENT|nr:MULTISPECIES: helix-turn-helix transcriptional regulator [Pseudomonas]MBG6289715.1 helix-turn-helix transcriptional regulator [Pseudomonas nitroreducens]NMZ59195.1 helix-turn-helix transcriptional regulator [Pseudomonas nitroreducens]QIE90919.1 helix-turn-helix transcriptional regulator [Pseudomonas nitroreducens]WEW96468.1 helix-turn-helix transcriptional regulator [Pseudomonas nitroreducens]
MSLEALAYDHQDGEEILPHCHTQAQLIHSISGVMLVGAAQKSWVVPAGHALWVPPGTEHQLRMFGRVRMRTLFMPASNWPWGGQQCQLLGVTPLLRELLVAASAVQPGDGNERRRRCLHELLLVEMDAAQTVGIHLAMPRDPRLLRLCNAVIGAPADETGMEEWAQQLNISSRTLARLFQRELGMNFSDWRTRVRMVLSLQRLLSGAPVLEVALEHGYQSPSAFSQTFKRVLGQSPSHYQAAHS